MLSLIIGCSDSDWSADSLTSRASHEVELTLDFGLNARLSSRAAGERPLESSDDWQKVSSMRVYMFRSDTETGTYTYYRPTVLGTTLDYLYVPEFSGKTDVWGDDEPDWEEHELVVTGMTLPDGWYRLVAIGRDDIDGDEAADGVWNFTTLVEGTTTLADLTATVRSTSAATRELFVGFTTSGQQVASNSVIHETIILKRAVAGVLMYVENIAAEVSGTPVAGIGIVRRQHTWAETLIDTIAAGANSTELAAAGASLVGTTPAATDYILRYNIPAGATATNGYYTGLNTTNTAHPNSVLAGAFVTPQAKPVDAADCTMELVYLDASGQVIRSRRIKYRNADSTTSLNYPLIANHIYCIGNRNVTDDTDEPIDLGETPNDIIIVHGSWQAVIDIAM